MGDRGQKNVSTCGKRSLCPSCVRKTDKPVLYVSTVLWLLVSEQRILSSEALYRYTTKAEMKWLNGMTNGVSVDRELLGLFFMS